MKTINVLIFSFFLFFFIFISCDFDKTVEVDKSLNYSFFVAGHTYGAPGVDNQGLHPPFEAFYNDINNYPKMTMGILTGDIVKNSTEQDWNEVDTSLSRLNMPIYFVMGNHDVQNRPLVESRYGQTYSSFLYEKDLFIILDANLADWRIEGSQLDFLFGTLNDHHAEVNNIFIFFHQLIWLKDNHPLENNPPNSFEGKSDALNFWTTLEPYFRALGQPIFLFAGDVGALPHSPSLMYYKEDNITYVSSGMGTPDKGNFVVVEVLENGDVFMKPIWLSDSSLSDNIEDYPPK